MGLFFAMGEYPIIDELGHGHNCYSSITIYGENLWEKFMGKINGENLWGKLMGKINEENLWGKLMVLFTIANLL